MSPQEAFWNSWFGVSVAVMEIAVVLAIVSIAITFFRRRLHRTAKL